MALRDFKTRTRNFSPGFGLVLKLTSELPRKYDEKVFGDGEQKGLILAGKVVNTLGTDHVAGWKPRIKETVSVLVRPGDQRKTIFEDLAKSNESRTFLLEGVVGADATALEARWAHGAGTNRSIQEIEIVGAPHISFENPVDDGPKSGYLRLNLDGTPTTFDERLPDGSWVEHEIPYQTLIERLSQALDKDLKFRVGQRALFPSLVTVVGGQAELESALTDFRADGMTHCMVRTFVAGTTDPAKVDIQLLSWPQDVPPNGTFEGATYEMPTLLETKRFAALRDGSEEAMMEVIPGYVLSLVGNPTDKTKSAKHKFCHDVANGISEKQKSMFASQSYGPGIAIRAANDQGDILGLVRLASRTEGPQYRNLLAIPTANFDASLIKYEANSQKPAESGSDVPLGT